MRITTLIIVVRFIDISPLPPNQEVMQPKRWALAKSRRSNLSSVDENRAGSQLYCPIGCGAKYCQIQGATATHSHDDQFHFRFQRELNDLPIWGADTHRRLNLESLTSLRWDQFIELVCRCCDGLFCLG